MALTKNEAYYAAHCVMLLVTFLAGLIVAIGLIWKGRRKKDPARWCLPVAKFAAALFTM